MLPSQERRKEIDRLRRLIERSSAPRFQMFLIVAFTAASAFLASFVMLHSALHMMWLRYLLSAAFGYCIFLMTLWVWLKYRREDILENLDVPSSNGSGGSSCTDSFHGGGGHSGGGGASSSFDGPATPSGSGAHSGISDISTDIDVGEFAIVLLLIAVVLSALGVSAWIVWIAPEFLAEILFDSILAAGLYRRIKTLEQRDWMSTAIEKTLFPYIAVSAIFVCGGAILQAKVPEVQSLHDAAVHLRSK